MSGKLLDETGLAEVWRKVQQRSIPLKGLSQNDYDSLDESEKQKDVLYICTPASGGQATLYYKGKQLSNSTSGGGTDSGSFSGLVEWTNINGRPDLSNVSSMKYVSIVLQQSLWLENGQQTIDCPGVITDDSQLVVTIPKKEDEEAYFNSVIRPVEQLEDQIVFHADATPEQDITVNVYIVNRVDVTLLGGGTFKWWSPMMTSEKTPTPYVASADVDSAGSAEPYKAFDGTVTTYWRSISTNKFVGLQFDFGKRTYISGVRLMSSITSSISERYPKTFDLQGSNDGTEWTRFYREDGSRFNSGFTAGIKYEYEFLPVCYRYYKIYCKTTFGSSGNGYAIAEVEFNKLVQEETT